MCSRYTTSPESSFKNRLYNTADQNSKGFLTTAEFSGSLKAGTATLATKAMFAAMSGAAGGAISSAVYGQNIEKGLAYGAAEGAATSAAVYGARQYSNNVRSQKASAGNKSASHGKRLRVSTTVDIQEGIYDMSRELSKLAGHVIDPRIAYDRLSHWFLSTVEDLNNNGILDFRTDELKAYSFIGRQVVPQGQSAWQSMLNADINTALKAFRSGNNALWNKISGKNLIPHVIIIQVNSSR